MREVLELAMEVRGVMAERDAAIARAEAAEKFRDSYKRQLCEEMVAHGDTRTRAEAAEKQTKAAVAETIEAWRERDLWAGKADKFEARVRELEAALRDLDETQIEYRRLHDLFGAGKVVTGRAWDRMRRAGDRAHSLLAQGQEGPTP